MRSRCSLVDILGENKRLPIECQGEQVRAGRRPGAGKEAIRELDGGQLVRLWSADL